MEYQAGCGILEGEMQLPAQVPHYKQAFLPLPAPQLSPGSPGKVVPMQSWDQYSLSGPGHTPPANWNYNRQTAAFTPSLCLLS